MDASEKAVQVTVKVTDNGVPSTFEMRANEHMRLKMVKRWVIMDTDPSVSRVARYRADHPLNAYNAWTASVYIARWFKTRALAQEALEAMWSERLVLAERTARQAVEIRPDNPAMVS
mgnify:CR=1 FL=1|tara:strand:+ start:6113 stop:6463 length:351 start_codon:yes stop_codon:yes gene_type:complete